MATPPRPNAATWFRRSLALTLVLSACLVLLFALRPGYGAFFVSTTLAFVIAGLLWSPGAPPRPGQHWRGLARPPSVPTTLTLVRTYRVSAAR